MSSRELTAAGITDPALRAGYERCRRLNAAHGKTYYLATLLLPPPKRPYVHALYGFARYADDMVDDLDPTRSVEERTRRFTDWSQRVRSDLAWASSADPICRALLDTLTRWRIPTSYVGEFLDSMEADLRVARYADFAALTSYMRGSAAVIGLQMLPILGRADDSIDSSVLEGHAVALGIAFQLTNFLRDIGEDWQRGRIYLPEDSMRQFGVDADRLARGWPDPAVRELLSFEVARAREFYAAAYGGIELVHSSSQPCLRTAFTLYSEILDRIERADYDVFSHRVAVPRRRRIRVGGGGLLRAWSARSRGSADTRGGDRATPR